MNVVGIDPGTERSGIVWFDSSTMQVERAYDQQDNDDVLETYLRHGLPTRYFADGGKVDLVVCEDVESFMLRVGYTTFQTVKWCGRFQQVVLDLGFNFHFIKNSVVKHCLCHTTRANENDVHAAVRDAFGGGNVKGTKSQRGPCYGVSGHAWSALAVALVAARWPEVWNQS